MRGPELPKMVLDVPPSLRYGGQVNAGHAGVLQKPVGRRTLSVQTTMKFFTFFALLAATILVNPGFGQDSAKPATKTAVLAGGCFWCIQPALEKADGWIKAGVGYCGGTEPNPTYDLVGSEKTQY